MKARKLLENAALGPDELRVICEAFNGAWEVLKQTNGSGKLTIEVCRLRLANSVLQAYRDGTTDPDQLKATALQAMKRWA